MLFGVNQRLRVEDVDSPLIQIRPVKTVCVVVVTGDRGLCGGYNTIAIRKVPPPPPFSLHARPAAGGQPVRAASAVERGHTQPTCIYVTCP